MGSPSAAPRRGRHPRVTVTGDVIAMTRKSAALTVAALTLIALVCVAVLVPVPYVVLSPGITENTLGAFHGKAVISITGHKTYPTTGHLDLTTVSVTSPDSKPRLPDILSAWWNTDEIVLPRDVIYPPDQSVDTVNKQNQTQMLGSQSSAIAVGLEAAGIDAVKVTVAEPPAKDSPAAGLIRKGDEVVSVDGARVTSSADVVSTVSALAPGSRVRIGIVRGGSHRTVVVTTEPDPGDNTMSRIGVSVTTALDPPFDVNIDLGQDIGGPSAGLMFSLGIYDKLTPGSLSGGKFVAGTGTIDVSGAVGPIGGIQQKIAGAYANGATIFLVPAGDCQEAVGSDLAGSVELVKVSTIDDAIGALASLTGSSERAVPRCAP